MAVEKLIVDHIDTWTTALQTRSTAGRGSSGKIELYGIKKLRELILELAVRGKLVPQDPNDEPASELLKHIAAEKAELVKQGKIKKQKPLPEISEEEKPFELPMGWEWTRLGSISNYGFCDKAEPEDVTPETWILELEDIEKVTSKLINKVTFAERPFKSSKNRFSQGDVLYGKLRPYLDKVIVANEPGVCTTEIIPITSYGNIYPEFLRLLLKAPNFIIYANSSTHGMNLPRLGTEKAQQAVIELAPIQEQLRIVSRVDKLMSLCDQLEQHSLTSLDAHQQLVETLLTTLTDSQNADELAENWARISEHFDTLFTTEASIAALKQTILQLAVMGKLVPQDPNDEPASELLKRIAQEKAQLVKDGKMKKQKPLPPISDEEKPFELPIGWEWCRLGECINLISGQHLKPDEYEEECHGEMLPYITGPAEFGLISPTYSKYTNEKRAIAAKGDILITCKGAGLGKLNVADTNIAISRQLMAINVIRMNSEYLKIILDSMYGYFQSKGVGIAIPGISREDVMEPLIMLPPFEEQKRIMENLYKLNFLIEDIKFRIKSAQQTQLHLADALTDAAIN
ncbi:restriction endonuclease [Salmonella enterica subsp. enterica serovar Wilhelmsburg]|uniref:Restriction endonuclease n=2 Tax=Salmonella enterica subsp. enterica serovar Wilhelmsburg TaxID=1960126 RepID=A0A659Q7K4_SALET|nr:restriction endonuclease subunit S [Salmonella enterica]ELX9017400.1 restriction endonuclease subunit S [Salmonella enterica]TGC59082.1 restriction endonuclease [Salmonella enterica subsp. enterica serovar Wilhelmsburg]TGC66157.1 restriction endonuclease [Salmonella enterica subsp. enterica serovar Wilhelmsburg]TGC72981.1 restriction endonuclease [Salmonella enterica subsp. enterica serovar Wilhelmsburg]TGC82357.1 restriction endonuclease [Salmonella enterica subsp. enterica serovar Wilhelm